MAFALNKEQKSSLERFLNRRGLKARAIELLGKAVESNDLPRGELTQNKNASYATLTENLEKAIQEKWLTQKDLVAMLDESEVAGRQHICVYRMPRTGTQTILDEIANPRDCKHSAATVAEFCEMPSSSFARMLKATANESMVKIVARRRYWVAETDQEYSSADEQWIHRWIEEERAAVIVKASTDSKLVQIRVPPRERAAGETGKTVYDFLKTTLGDHYEIGAGSWFARVQVVSITDAFNAILDNHDDFVLRYDTPESDSAKSSVSGKGALKELNDLRDDEMWRYADGYARRTMRGSWTLNGSDPIFTHLNYDTVRLNATTSVEFARVFFPKLATDQEVEHVLKRINDHLP